jgi:hypothetical protein
MAKVRVIYDLLTYFRPGSVEIKPIYRCRNYSASCQHGRNETARHLISVLILPSGLSLPFQKDVAVIYDNWEQAGLLRCLLCAILQQ